MLAGTALASELYAFHSFLVGKEMGVHSQMTEDVLDGRVSLCALSEESLQGYLGFGVLCECHHLIPVTAGAPVVLNGIGCGLVLLGFHSERTFISPLCFCSEGSHDGQRHVYVWSAYDIASECECEPLFHHGSYHEQSAYVLTAHASREGKAASLQFLSCDAQGWESGLFGIFYLSTQFAQSIHQYAYRAMAHAFGAGDDVCACGDAQVSGQESHGSSCCHDVYGMGH